MVKIEEGHDPDVRILLVLRQMTHLRDLSAANDSNADHGRSPLAGPGTPSGALPAVISIRAKHVACLPCVYENFSFIFVKVFMA